MSLRFDSPIITTNGLALNGPDAVLELSRSMQVHNVEGAEEIEQQMAEAIKLGTPEAAKFAYGLAVMWLGDNVRHSRRVN